MRTIQHPTDRCFILWDRQIAAYWSTNQSRWILYDSDKIWKTCKKIKVWHWPVSQITLLLSWAFVESNWQLAVCRSPFSLLKLQQICATRSGKPSGSQTWPHPITKGFTDEAIMVAKTSWWSWISDICNTVGHSVHSISNARITIRST